MSTELAGASIRTLRKQLGISSKELAYELGVARTTVSHWESGSVPIGRERIEEIAEILEVEPEDLEVGKW